MRRSRLRRLAIVLAAAAVAATTAACGSSGSSGAAPTTTAAAPATRTVQSAEGPVEVPAQPKRIVSVDYVTPYILFDLKAPIVGALDLSNGANGEQFKTITPIGNDSGEINYEAIIGLNPDVILSIDGSSGVDVARLKAIAPTVSIPASTDTSWKGLVKQTAEIVGLSDALAAREQAYQAKVTEVKTQRAAQITSSGSWATAGTYDGDAWYLYGTGSGPSSVMADLGITFDTATKAAGDSLEQRSVEQLNTLSDAKVILFDDLGPPVTIEGAAAKMQANPLFAALPAAQAKRVYVGSYNVTTYGDAEKVLTSINDILGKF
ncbi:MAG: hypothetical protein ABS81_03065 [Pseudonocardia sp. SCN 72-86]|nr:MAG: hypothetical protein ABS81_03065 [Pseudonocardia sp. SCN 72-86]